MTDFWDDLDLAIQQAEREVTQALDLPPGLEVVFDRSSVEEDEESDDGIAEGQETMFGADDDFKLAWQEWKGMPEFSQANLLPRHSVVVNFLSLDDLKAFEQLIGQPIVITSSRGIWYPKQAIASYADKRFRAIE